MRLLYTLPALLARQVWCWDHFDEPESLKDALQENDFTLVAFVHPTDETTAPLEDEWTLVRKSHFNDARITSIDCSVAPRTCSSLSISSFPTIRLYHRSGRFDRYRGPRSASSINSFLQRMLRPSPLSYIDASNATGFLSSDEIIFISYLGSSPADAPLEKLFLRAAERCHDRYSFAISSAPPPPIPQTQAQPGSESNSAVVPPKILCYNHPSGTQRHLTALRNFASLETFISQCATPLVPALTRRNEITFYSSGKSIVHYFFSSEKDRQAYVSEILPLARKYSEYLHFTTTDVREYPEAPALMGFQFQDNNKKGRVAVQNPSNGEVFPWDNGSEKITAAKVEGFLIDIIQGRVKPWRRRDKGNTEKMGEKTEL